METGFGERTRDAQAPGREGARARLGRYAIWQLKDFMVERGVWIAALGVIALSIFRGTYDYAPIVRDAVITSAQGTGYVPPTEAEHFRNGLSFLVATGSFIATLIASHGIVSRDRERGYQRFLFAKPVSIARYYLQAFLVNGAGLLIVMAALLAATGLVFLRVIPDVPTYLAYTAGQYAMLGGLVMLLSTLVRYDFALGALIVGAAAPVDSLAWDPQGTTVLKLLSLVLPPIGSLVHAGQGLSRGGPVAQWLVTPLIYGAIYVAGALFVLRRRSISR